MTTTALQPPTTGILRHALTFRIPGQTIVAWATSSRLAATVMGMLAVGVALSILTTTETDWWQYHFSALGTVSDFSGFMFNGSLIAAGLVVGLFSLRIHAELRALSAGRGRAPSRVFVVLVASVGVHLAGVGFIPLHTNTFLHDRAASGIMLSFLGMLGVTLRRRRSVPRVLMAATIAVFTLLIAVIVLFSTGVINLAVLELVGFALIFSWIGVLSRCVSHAQTHDTPAPLCSEVRPRRRARRPATQRRPVARTAAPRPRPSRRTGTGVGRSGAASPHPRRSVLRASRAAALLYRRGRGQIADRAGHRVTAARLRLLRRRVRLPVRVARVGSGHPAARRVVDRRRLAAGRTVIRV